MFCPNCGAQIQDGSRFCSMCGKAVAALVCSGCGSPIKADSIFCPNCGHNLKTSSLPEPPSAAPPAGIVSDLKELAASEAVLMDTGLFPITYVKNMMTSINGKLYLTNKRLVFKAGKLQGDAGMFGGDAAAKAKQYLSLPLAEITNVEAGMVTLVIQTSERYKFGGMRKTKEWSAAILGAAGRG
jgi:hypothetical protein